MPRHQDQQGPEQVARPPGARGGGGVVTSPGRGFDPMLAMWSPAQGQQGVRHCRGLFSRQQEARRLLRSWTRAGRAATPQVTCQGAPGPGHAHGGERRGPPRGGRPRQGHARLRAGATRSAFHVEPRFWRRPLPPPPPASPRPAVHGAGFTRVGLVRSFFSIIYLFLLDAS